jgi:hypothetical protein
MSGELSGLSASDPLVQLARLAGLVRRRNAGEKISIPFVTIHCNAQNYYGTVLDVTNANGKDLILLDTTSSGSYSTDVTHILGSMICAVTIHDVLRTDLNKPQLTKVSRLELDRSLVSFRESLPDESLSVTISSVVTPDNFESIAFAFPRLANAIDSACNDDMGREAFGTVRSITFSAGEADSISRVDDELLISVAMPFSARSDTAGWQRALEAVL